MPPERLYVFKLSLKKEDFKVEDRLNCYERLIHFRQRVGGAKLSGFARQRCFDVSLCGGNGH